jgi:hypothetical protein
LFHARRDAARASSEQPGQFENRFMSESWFIAPSRLTLLRHRIWHQRRRITRRRRSSKARLAVISD